MSEDLFARANEADIEAIAGVRLFRAGRRLRGECPVCGASKGKRAGGAFWVDPDHGRWGCFSGGGECAEGGDAVALERALRGGTPREAAERLTGGDVAPATSRRQTPRRPAGEAKPDDQATRAADMAARLWREARPAAGTLAERYLRARGLGGPVLAGMLRRLRFHPHAFWGGEPGAWIFAPAMVAALHTPDGPTGGVHLTYLRPDGSAKAALDPAKRMWGPQKSADGRAAGCWLIGPRGAGPLIIGEGIESTASAAALYGKPCRVAAALSLRALQGGWLADAYGRYDPAMPAGDPESPPFTWPLADLDVPEVMIAVDRDMSPVTVKARKATGGTWRAPMDADARAKVCATLATHAWQAANPHLSAANVRAIAPAAGRDFNDELKARAA